PLARAELRQVLALLLLGAPLHDARADERGLHRDDRADRAVAAADLLDDQPVGEVVQARAAVLGGHDRAEVALVCDLLDEIEVEVVVARVFARLDHDLVVGELARGLLDQALLVGQVEVHRASFQCSSLGDFQGAAILRSISSASPSIGSRSWDSESRSRRVTVRSSRLWWSIVKQNGVPISS